MPHDTSGRRVGFRVVIDDFSAHYATGDDGIQVIARHMNYGLYRVEGKSDCPRDALNICRMLSLKPEILKMVEESY